MYSKSYLKFVNFFKINVLPNAEKPAVLIRKKV